MSHKERLLIYFMLVTLCIMMSTTMCSVNELTEKYTTEFALIDEIIANKMQMEEEENA